MSLLFTCFPANRPAGTNQRLYDGYSELANEYKNKHNMRVTVERDYISASDAHLKRLEINSLKRSCLDVPYY